MELHPTKFSKYLVVEILDVWVMVNAIGFVEEENYFDHYSADVGVAEEELVVGEVVGYFEEIRSPVVLVRQSVEKEAMVLLEIDFLVEDMDFLVEDMDCGDVVQKEKAEKVVGEP